MHSRTAAYTFLFAAGLAGTAFAQGPDSGRTRKPDESIPKDYRPPPGMCRIWLDKVPAKQQPASTDCPTALKNKPANAKVIFGDDYAERRGKPDENEVPFIKKFRDDRKP